MRNGSRIDDPLAAAREFIASDGSYQRYDLAPVKHDEVLTKEDIQVANAMIARMSPRVIAGIYARAPAINAALGQVPASASLAAPDDAVPWEGLEQLMRAMDGIPEVGLPRKTKVLHKKRPALIPILDSVVEAYLRNVDRIRRTGDAPRDAVELMWSYKRELDATLTVLRPLREELRRREIDLTECRLLDLFLWGYSDTYTPIFRRDESGAPAETRGASSRTKPPSRALIELEIFRDDDAGYLAWLAAHQEGYVLNMARTPRAEYLILHRATCRTINGQPSRGGPWTGPYVKGCSDDELVIAAWCGRKLGAAPRRCGTCFR
ncbi:MAG: DUF6308 family protein [Gaiellaceae bacterium]